MSSHRERLSVDTHKPTGRGEPCPRCGHPARRSYDGSASGYKSCKRLLVNALHPISDRFRHGAEYGYCPCSLVQRQIEAAHRASVRGVTA